MRPEEPSSPSSARDPEGGGGAAGRRGRRRRCPRCPACLLGGAAGGEGDYWRSSRGQPHRAPGGGEMMQWFARRLGNQAVRTPAVHDLLDEIFGCATAEERAALLTVLQQWPDKTRPAAPGGAVTGRTGTPRVPGTPGSIDTQGTAGPVSPADARRWRASDVVEMLQRFLLHFSFLPYLLKCNDAIGSSGSVNLLDIGFSAEDWRAFAVAQRYGGSTGSCNPWQTEGRDLGVK